MTAAGVPTIVVSDPRYQQQCGSSLFARGFDEQGNLIRDESSLPLWHLDGIGWYDTAAPPRRHKHWAQTVGLVDHEEVWRCACGANGGPKEPWVHITPHHARYAPELERRSLWRKVFGR